MMNVVNETRQGVVGTAPIEGQFLPPAKVVEWHQFLKSI
jgi:hypothetical protein